LAWRMNYVERGLYIAVLAYGCARWGLRLEKSEQIKKYYREMESRRAEGDDEKLQSLKERWQEEDDGIVFLRH
ncbi:MAG TPA: hypothetical protein VNH64_09860, partial [Parvularculaceae bacterium]|nr:hypothetical protein [Parvularculaceae bacterium]